jgi:hypothetical protein
LETKLLQVPHCDQRPTSTRPGWTPSCRYKKSSSLNAWAAEDEEESWLSTFFFMMQAHELISRDTAVGQVPSMAQIPPSGGGDFSRRTSLIEEVVLEKTRAEWLTIRIYWILVDSTLETPQVSKTLSCDLPSLISTDRLSLQTHSEKVNSTQKVYQAHQDDHSFLAGFADKWKS